MVCTTWERIYKRNKSRRDSIVLIKMTNTTRNIKKKNCDNFKIIVDTNTHARSEHDITSSRPPKEIYCPMQTSVTYFCQRHEIYDHRFYRTITVKSRQQRRGESYSLLGRRLWPMADIWLRRRVVIVVFVHLHRLQNFCNASRRSPSHCPFYDS